jgi:uncharacterized protein with beta-barrel porin domain
VAFSSSGDMWSIASRICVRYALVALAAALLFGPLTGEARAADAGPIVPVSVAPPPPPPVSTTSANNAISTEFAAFDLGSKFLHTMNDHSTSYFGGGYTLPNPEGGGAGNDQPRFRSWVETYGLWSSTAAREGFVGDNRRSLGGVAGFGANIVPGGWVGVSIDQSRTNINAPAAMQSAGFDLTQIGLNGSYEFGPWTLSGGAIRGFGSVGSNRNTSTGPAGTSFNADLWGAITELSYYWGLGNARIVPKAGADWQRTHTVAYSESGLSLEAVSVPDVVATRTRVFAGAEVGRSWMADNIMIDLSAYGRFLDAVERSQPTLLVTTTTGLSPTLIQGAVEGQYGVDAGAMATFRLTPLSRVYVGFESHFRDGYQAYGGTIGGEVKW